MLMFKILRSNPLPLTGKAGMGCALNYHQCGLLHFHPLPNPPPSRGGDATNTPSPLVGEGLQAIGLRYKCEARSFSPLPRIKYGAGSSPLPQGARGLDCSRVQSCRGF